MLRPAALSSALVAIAIASGSSPARAEARPAAPAPAPATSAAAPEAEPPTAAGALPAWETERATRRSGFTAGASFGLGFGDASGYPNELAQIGEPAWRSKTGGLGSGLTLWLGGAFTDWFTFGLGVESTGVKGDKALAGGGAFIFRVQTFPLFARGGVWRDVGVFADFGTGGGTIQVQEDRRELANGGAMSNATVGAFWESFRWFGGRLVGGPEVWWQYAWSDSLERRTGIVGFRTQFYGGP
jgi:hypothetical protein